MANGPYIAEAAFLIGDPARANILAALMDGRARTAKELGITAGVAPSTASGHLTKLAEGALLEVASSGRHRYYRLASSAVARVLEDLMGLAAEEPHRHRPKSHCDQGLVRARTCYDHFAGKLGVALADALIERKQMIMAADGGVVTEAGHSFLTSLGVALENRGRSRRAFCRPCLDWSERRWHIGGFVGAAITSRLFDLGWTERQRDSRAVTITATGEQALRQVFNVQL